MDNYQKLAKKIKETKIIPKEEKPINNIPFCVLPKHHLKYHTTGCLVKAFRSAGSSMSYRTLLRHEAKGNIKFPRSATDFKKLGGYSLGKKVGAVRYMTEQEINQIVKAFLPGGIGYWKNE